jgi:uncharacterized protein with FMN-binding domain
MSTYLSRRRVGTAAASSVAGLVIVLALHPGKSGAIKPRASKAVEGPPTSQPTGQPTAPPNAGAPVASRTATGSAENYGYGTLSVSVTVNGQHIADVSVAHLQTIDPYSQALANQVIPMLRREVMNAQSANIQGISGATYTSEAYAYSLQAALTHLGI